ncbi:MAG: beta-glucosidase [Candidatus Ordinivivax streblomastigis]|uniref:Beta-glucosidase n=1 Tax=Candidatus Ordinivivax streblomastigis TaxID=2540710 RepID=A0A5M8NUJ7_9BACT|nr:MAG: beta-glucosidase [Candidatus Ordinivivax streblomastigis]
MKHNRISISLLVLACGLTVACTPSAPVYKDASAPVEKRIKDLMSRMTLEEKAAQLDMLSANNILENAGTFIEENLVHFFDSVCIGSIHDFYPKTAAISNELQRRAVEKSRLGIPILFIEEGLHGYCGAGSTTFPVPIGNASTWDTTLMYRIGRAIATETRAHGVHFLLAPNLDLGRDPRWGRTEETFGEDVYLNARMAVNLIKGMQGNSLRDDNAVVAEPKHFGVHGIPENGSNTGPVFIGEREARSTHLYVFEKAIKEAKARGIMAAYHDIDGVPCISNHWLLTDLLRKEWGFTGMVVTDLGAIRRLLEPHYTAVTPKDAISQAINAGLDMQFYDFDHEVFQTSVVEAVKDGTISKEKFERAVAAVLRVKFELGLFENPYTDETLIDKVFHNEEHQQLALEAGRKSIILLKNDNQTLPLSRETKKIALIGNLADASAIGDYSPREAKGITLYEALSKRFGKDVQINYIQTGISNMLTTVPTSSLTVPGKSMQIGLSTEYFNSSDLTGKPAYAAVEENLQGYWHNLSPAPGINPDSFSVRYTGLLTIPVDGLYEFNLSSDGNAKFYLNNELFIDKWTDSNENRRSRPKQIILKGGQKIPVRLEYAKKNENASVDVRWRMVELTNNSAFFNKITQAAADADVVILTLGETNQEVGEGKDRQNLNLKQMDIDMLQAAAKAGKPIVSVLLNGRPLVFTPVAENSAAILEAWFPGEKGGDVITDVLFGNYNPSGKLTISIPRQQGPTPIYYAKKPSSLRNYTDGNGEPLYPFGHGLSYSTFEYGNLSITPSEPTVKDVISVSLDITNTSAVNGIETVQLYVRDKLGSVSTPIKALKGFSQVFLKAGETQRVSMTLQPEEHLWLINLDMKRVVEPGEFDIMIGSSSSNIKLTQMFNLK